MNCLSKCVRVAVVPTVAAFALCIGYAKAKESTEVAAQSVQTAGTGETAVVLSPKKTYEEGNTFLVPGGEVFGVKFFTHGVIIVDTGSVETEEGNVDPARKAGIKKNDILRKIDGEEVNTVEEVSERISHSDG